MKAWYLPCDEPLRMVNSVSFICQSVNLYDTLDSDVDLLDYVYYIYKL